MKKLFRIFLLCCVFGAVLLSTGCSMGKYQYPFAQPVGNVTKVEILRYYYMNYPEKSYTTLLAELDLEEAKKMLEGFSKYYCTKGFLDGPMAAYSDVVLVISYANGEGEVLGESNCANISTDGEWEVNPYYFSDQWGDILTEIIYLLDKG